MKYDEKFEKFYDELIRDEAYLLGKKKKKARDENINNIVFSFILIIIGLIIIIWTIKNVNSIYLLYGIPIAYVLVIVFIKKYLLFNGKGLEYVAEYNEKVIKRMLVSLDRKGVFHKHYSIDSDVYDEAEFEKYDRFSSDFSVYGKLKDNIDYSLGYVKTEYFDGSVRYHKYTNLFYGLFVSVNCPNKIGTSIYIKNGDNVFFRKIGYYVVPSKKLKIKLGDLDFDYEFDVYCEDKKMVLKLLTPDIMRLFLDFKKEMNIRYEITIKDGNIYYRFFCGDLFRKSGFGRKIFDKDVLYKYYRVIDFSLLLSEKLVDNMGNNNKKNSKIGVNM